MTPPVSVEGNCQQVPLMDKTLQLTMAVAVRLGTVWIARSFGEVTPTAVGTILQITKLDYVEDRIPLETKVIAEKLPDVSRWHSSKQVGNLPP